MADETTQQQVAVQPTQQRTFDLESTTLKGTDIYGKMKPFSTQAREYNSDKMAGESYYLYRFKGTIITVPAKFHMAYEKFDVLEVTLTGAINAREVADANSPGGKKMVDTQSYGLDGYLTTQDDLAMLKIAQHKATMQRATKTIQKIDVSKELTQEELDELISQA